MKEQNQIKKMERAAEMLRVVAHSVRIALIELLNKEKKLSVSDIQLALGLTQSMTSQHLASLKGIGIVSFVKDGNVCFYELKNRNVLKLLKCLNECICID